MRALVLERCSARYRLSVPYSGTRGASAGPRPIPLSTCIVRAISTRSAPSRPAEIATLLEVADPETGLIVRTLASTGLRFGELAGLRRSAVRP